MTNRARRSANVMPTSRCSHAAATRPKRLRGDVDESSTEAAGIEALLAEIDQRHSVELARIAELEAELPRLDAEEAELSEKAREMSEAREVLESATAAIRSQRTDTHVRRGRCG
ncbi:MAG: hypothetical protein M5U19_12905 [Microthrixaceae bacterium]|nr:hypothetical protein [Microthrixaceae bacterium]